MTARLYKKPESPYWFMDLRPYGGSRRSTGRVKKTEARIVADDEVKKYLDKQQLGLSESITLDQGLQRLAGITKGSYSKTIRDTRQRVIGPDKDQFSPDFLMSDLTTVRVAEFRDLRLGGLRAPRSVSNDLRIIRRVYNLCRTEWGVAVNPQVQFKEPAARVRRRVLSLEDEMDLLRELDPSVQRKGLPAAQDHYMRAQLQDARDLTVILIDTGMRVGEAVALRWGDVDVQTKTFTVYRPKTDTMTVLSMTQRVQDIFIRRRGNTYDSKYVFPAWDHQKVDIMNHRGESGSSRSIRRAIDRVGINSDPEIVAKFGTFTIHSFRDTFCSRLIERGLSKAGTQKLLGQSTPNMVDKYTHLEDLSTAETAARLLSGH